jgi:hypothetical protein
MGMSIALKENRAARPGFMAYSTLSQNSHPGLMYPPPILFCEEKNRLLNAFLQAVHELNAVQNQQIRAVIEGDNDFNRFDVLLHVAQEKKDMAKYAWMGHIEAHQCGEG